MVISQGSYDASFLLEIELGPIYSQHLSVSWSWWFWVLWHWTWRPSSPSNEIVKNKWKNKNRRPGMPSHSLVRETEQYLSENHRKRCWPNWLQVFMTCRIYFARGRWMLSTHTHLGSPDTSWHEFQQDHPISWRVVVATAELKEPNYVTKFRGKSILSTIKILTMLHVSYLARNDEGAPGSVWRC